MINLREFASALDGKPLAVFGLARSGLSTVKAARAADVEIIAWDDNETARAKAKDLGANIQRLDKDTLSNCAALVLAPGVPLHFPTPHDVVIAAREAGIEIISDIEIFYRAAPAHLKIVGITGTNGKSTTTALLGHVLKECGMPAVIGGNIGTPVLDLNVDLPISTAVLELSSYQLDLCPTLALDIAVLLNLSPDHLDRHGSMDGYIAAKERIFKGAKTSIVGVDDEQSKALRARVGANPISAKDDLGDVKNPNLRGDHNRQNMAAALAVCEALGCKKSDVIKAFETYPGLAHRQFLVREIGGVIYVNDSKATNAEAAEKALGAYDNIYWIVGGQAKEGGLNGLEPLMPRVRHSFLIGEAAEAFAKWLEAEGAPYTICETLDVATTKAHEMAQAAGAGTVLLSPACASWDQFESFEHRGDKLTELVGAL